MSGRGASVVITVAAVVLLGLEAVGLRAGSGAVLLVGGFLALISGLLIARVSLPTAAIGAICLAAFTSPWNGIKFGPLQPGDLLILLSLALFVATDIGSEHPKMPRWVTQLAFAILIVAAVKEVLPPDAHYLAQRIVVGADGQPTIEFQSNLIVAFKFLLGIGAIPMAFGFAVMHDRRALRWLAIAFASGVAVSSLIAFSDGQGITSLSRTIVHIGFPPTRQGGLTKHPNFLAASCVIAIAIAVWLLASRDRRDRIIGAALFPSIMLGVYATGSRGGTVCAVLAVGLAVVFIPRFRPHLPTISLAAGSLAVVSFVVFPGFGAALLKATRLGGGTHDTAGSNAVRAIVGAQGLDDFRHYPFVGIGLQVADQAQNVYIQELASGGLLLLGAMLIYTLGALRAAARLRHEYDLAAALLATLLAASLFNYLEADLTDRFFYVPQGLVVALGIIAARGAPAEDSDAETGALVAAGSA